MRFLESPASVRMHISLSLFVYHIVVSVCYQYPLHCHYFPPIPPLASGCCFHAKCCVLRTLRQMCCYCLFCHCDSPAFISLIFTISMHDHSVCSPPAALFSSVIYRPLLLVFRWLSSFSIFCLLSCTCRRFLTENLSLSHYMLFPPSLL